MQPVREAAYDLQSRGRLLVTQKGVAVEPSSVRGPIRLKMPGLSPGPQVPDAVPTSALDLLRPD